MGDAGFASVLSRAGYATGVISKAHFATYLTFKPTGSAECIESSATFDRSCG